MIATATIVMYGLMYLNTYVLDHVWFSQTRVWDGLADGCGDGHYHVGSHVRGTVVVIETREVYFHCSKALRRSDLWNPDKRIPKGGFSTLGQIARDQFKLPVPSRLIDFALNLDAKKNLY